MEETKLCDDVIILDEGMIKAQGSPNELKDSYANDHLIWYTEENEENNKKISEVGFEFKYNKNAYVIRIDNSKDATKLILAYPDLITDYEVIKGDMDSVFLNVTGKEL